MLNDNIYDSYWATDDDMKNVSFTVTLPTVQTFNRVQLQEYTPLGQRISAFSLDILNDAGSWMNAVRETTIGYKRIVRIPTVTSSAVRITIEASEASPALTDFSLFMAPHLPFVNLNPSEFPPASSLHNISYLCAHDRKHRIHVPDLDKGGKGSWLGLYRRDTLYG